MHGSASNRSDSPDHVEEGSANGASGANLMAKRERPKSARLTERPQAMEGTGTVQIAKGMLAGHTCTEGPGGCNCDDAVQSDDLRKKNDGTIPGFPVSGVGRQRLSGVVAREWPALCKLVQERRGSPLGKLYATCHRGLCAIYYAHTDSSGNKEGKPMVLFASETCLARKEPHSWHSDDNPR